MYTSLPADLGTVFCLLRAPSLIRAPPIVWRRPILSLMTKVHTVSLLIVRFSIRNHLWKIQNLGFPPKISDMTLLTSPAPSLGRTWYLNTTSPTKRDVEGGRRVTPLPHFPPIWALEHQIANFRRGIGIMC